MKSLKQGSAVVSFERPRLSLLPWRGKSYRTGRDSGEKQSRHVRNGPDRCKGEGSKVSIRYRARGFHFYLILSHEVGIINPYHRRDSEKAGDFLKVTQLISLRAGAAYRSVGL